MNPPLSITSVLGRVLLVLGACLLLAGRISASHIHPDEHLVYAQTDGTLRDAIYHQGWQDVHPPGWFSAFWVWRQAVGVHETTGRWASVLAGTLVVAVVVQLGRQVFGSARVGLFAGAALVANAYFNVYALELRPYAVAMLLASASTLAFWRLAQRPTRQRAILYGVCLAAMAYVHYFLAFVVAAHLLDWCLRRPAWRAWRQLLLAYIIALLVWLPWLPVFVGQLMTLRELTGGIGTSMTALPTSARTVSALVQLATNGLPWLWAMALAVALWTWRQRVRSLQLVVLWASGVPLIALAVNTVAAVYAPRYIASLSVALGLLAGAGLARLRPRALGTALLGVFVAANLSGLPSQWPQRETYRTFFQAMSAQAMPGDVVLVVHGNAGVNFFEWLFDQYASSTLHQHRATDLAQVREARRVWFLTHSWFDPDVRAAFEEVERTRPLHTVMGRCDLAWCYLVQLLEGPPGVTPVAAFHARNDDTLMYHGVEVTHTDAHTVVRLWWSAHGPLSHDYTASVQLLAADGTLLAQHDAGLPTPTTQMMPERVVLDVRTFEGAPPGVAAIVLVVYQPWDGTRLTLADGHDVQSLWPPQNS